MCTPNLGTGLAAESATKSVAGVASALVRLCAPDCAGGFASTRSLSEKEKWRGEVLSMPCFLDAPLVDPASAVPSRPASRSSVTGESVGAVLAGFLPSPPAENLRRPEKLPPAPSQVFH